MLLVFHAVAALNHWQPGNCSSSMPNDNSYRMQSCCAQNFAIIGSWFDGRKSCCNLASSNDGRTKKETDNIIQTRVKSAGVTSHLPVLCSHMTYVGRPFRFARDLLWQWTSNLQDGSAAPRHKHISGWVDQVSNEKFTPTFRSPVP